MYSNSESTFMVVYLHQLTDTKVHNAENRSIITQSETSQWPEPWRKTETRPGN